MNQLAPIINILQSIEGVTRSAMVRAFQESTPEIEEAILMQLSQGLRGDGVELPDYSRVSVSVYGKPPGPMKLYETGEFYQGVEARADSDGVEIIGTDDKTGMLELRYGSEIIKLSEENKERILHEVIRIRMLQNIRSAWNH